MESSWSKRCGGDSIVVERIQALWLSPSLNQSDNQFSHLAHLAKFAAIIVRN